MSTGLHARPRRGLSPRRWLAAAGTAVVVAALVVTAPASDAAFVATSGNPQTITAGVSDAPTNLAATVSGQNVTVAWTGNIDAENFTVTGAPAGPGGTCSGVAWQTLGSVTTSPYIDASRAGQSSGWYCYSVTANIYLWTSTGNPVVAIQLPAAPQCAASPWNSHRMYQPGVIVSWNGHSWLANWKQKGNEPGSSGAWTDIAACPSGPIQTWAPGVTYAVGDQVTYGGKSYLCLQAHTSQAGWQPPNVPALWYDVS